MLIRGTHVTWVADSGLLQVISEEDVVSFQPGVIPPGSQYDRGMAHSNTYLLPRCGSLNATSAKAGKSRGCSGFPDRVHRAWVHTRGAPCTFSVVSWACWIKWGGTLVCLAPGTMPVGARVPQWCGACGVLWAFCYPLNVTGWPNTWGYS